MTWKLYLAAAAASVMLGTSAQASPISADFRSEFDLPDFSSAGPTVFESIGESVSGAPDLDETDEIANPNDFGGFATTDLSSSGLITLTGVHSPFGFANYDLAIFNISNIVFDAAESIIGVNLVSHNLFDPSYRLGVIAPSIAFTASGVTITFDTSGSGSNSDFEFADGGISTFQILTTGVSTVPTPATLPLMVLAFATFGLLRRRRRA